MKGFAPVRRPKVGKDLVCECGVKGSATLHRFTVKEFVQVCKCECKCGVPVHRFSTDGICCSL